MRRSLDVTVTVTVRVTFDDSPMPNGILPNDEWRRQYYDYYSVADVAEHLTFNFIRNQVTDVRELDGFADQPPAAVQFEQLGGWFFDVEEVTRVERDGG